MKKEVILEGMPARSVPESDPLFYNNRSWTTTFQDDGNDEQQILDYNFPG